MALDGLALIGEGLARHGLGAVDGGGGGGKITVVNLVGGGIVHIIGLAGASFHLRKGIALGGNHGGLQQLLRGIPAHLGHGHAQEVVLHAQGVHGPEGAVAHIQGQTPLIVAFLAVGGDEGEPVPRSLLPHGGQGGLGARIDLALFGMGQHHLFAGDGDGEGAPGEGRLAHLEGAVEAHGEGVHSVGGQQHPDLLLLSRCRGGKGYEPQQQHQGDAKTKRSFHTPLYSTSRPKRKGPDGFVDDYFEFRLQIRGQTGK